MLLVVFVAICDLVVKAFVRLVDFAGDLVGITFARLVDFAGDLVGITFVDFVDFIMACVVWVGYCLIVVCSLIDEVDNVSVVIVCVYVVGDIVAWSVVPSVDVCFVVDADVTVGDVGVVVNVDKPVIISE